MATQGEGLGGSLLPQRPLVVGVGQGHTETEDWGQEAESQPKQSTPGTRWHLGTLKMPALRLTQPPVSESWRKGEKEQRGQDHRHLVPL